MNGFLVLCRTRLEMLEEDLQYFTARCVDPDLACRSLDALIHVREAIDALTSERKVVVLGADSVDCVIPLPQNSVSHC